MTQAEALDILKTGVNVFLTGEPGSGKTHTINEYVKYLRERNVAVAITASTGIAATHLGGMTIHSWSGIGIKNKLDGYELNKIAGNEYIFKRIKRARVLVIDEISMLSAETLSMVEAVCREVKQNMLAFGGLQVILVGDFFQLPPIYPVRNRLDEKLLEQSRLYSTRRRNLFKISNGVSETQAELFEENFGHFAYDSSAWARAKPLVCYLTEQYRQDDDNFLAVLAAIRGNYFDEEHFEHLEARKISFKKTPPNALKLFSHNADVDKLNNEMLSKIKSEPEIFEMTTQGPAGLVEILVKGCLSPEILELKIGAEVMCTKNNKQMGFVNGTIGQVTGFASDSNYPIIRTRHGQTMEIEPMEWTVEENGRIRARLTQIPLRLAWAITVHKSQGMSLDEAVMDLSHVFEYGQGYVALSRVRRLAGLYLLGWNERAFLVHPEILEKDVAFRTESNNAELAILGLASGEKEKLHHNFILSCGGNLKIGLKKLK